LMTSIVTGGSFMGDPDLPCTTRSNLEKISC
jgi:hypothetical protein